VAPLEPGEAGFIDLLDKVIDEDRGEGLYILQLLYHTRGMTFTMAMILEGVSNIIESAPREDLREYFRTKVLEAVIKDGEKP
jgi:hypothetical protein